jgi:hypothetical protein
MLLRLDEDGARLRQKRPHDDAVADYVAPEHGKRVMVTRFYEPGDVLFGYSEASRSTIMCDVPVLAVLFGWKVCQRM